MLEHNDSERPATTSRHTPTISQQLNQEFKLPKIGIPSSRGRLMSRKENKAPTYLPSIRDDDQIDKNFRNTDMIHVNKDQNDIAQSEQNISKDQFAYEIQEKLKQIMHQQPLKVNEAIEADPVELQSDQISDDIDFQQKILQNKQIIKMHRKKTQLPDKKLPKPLQTLQKINEFNRPKYNKPQSNYEKKMKEYNMSLQNKFLQRKKQSLGIIPEKPQKIVQRAKSKKLIMLKDALVDQTKINDAKLNEAKLSTVSKQTKSGTNQTLKSSKNPSKDTARPQNYLNSNKSHKQPYIVPQTNKQTKKTQLIASPSKRISRTSALFDNIQSFLQNPMGSEKHQKLYQELYKKLKAKSIPQLEDQIKHINEKIGVDQNYDTKSTVEKDESLKEILLTSHPMERTVRDWKRIELKDKHNMKCQQSNFQKELDYISYLQEKNSNSLSKFIDHQKIMVELQIHRRISKSIGKDSRMNSQPDQEKKQSNNSFRQSNTAQEST